jgi:hypothetical protein
MGHPWLACSTDPHCTPPPPVLLRAACVSVCVHPCVCVCVCSCAICARVHPGSRRRQLAPLGVVGRPTRRATLGGVPVCVMGAQRPTRRATRGGVPVCVMGAQRPTRRATPGRCAGLCDGRTAPDPPRHPGRCAGLCDRPRYPGEVCRLVFSLPCPVRQTQRMRCAVSASEHLPCSILNTSSARDCGSPLAHLGPARRIPAPGSGGAQHAWTPVPPPKRCACGGGQGGAATPCARLPDHTPPGSLDCWSMPGHRGLRVTTELHPPPEIITKNGAGLGL